MNKLFLIILLISFSSFSQYDTTIKTPIYTSYFSFKYDMPLVVSYVLNKGGGTCSRDSLEFKSDHKLKTPNYSKSGYDKAHLANAEDFAYNCDLEEKTFRYYNAVPMTSSLNRGIWKTYETRIREISQTDSLLILCGGFDFKNDKGLFVPQKCFKIVKSLKTNKIIFILVFTNTRKSKVTNVTLNELIDESKYKFKL